MRYEVDTAALCASADSVAEALSRLERFSIADDLAPIAVAFPGGRTAGLAGQVAQAWQLRVLDTRSLLKGLGLRLSAAAESYAAAESEARRALAAGSASSSPVGRR